ncbi:MAG: YiiX/YebB-like N1pC/P60 family cysteine hydrolase [Bdellovibrio sp.]
MKMNLYSLFLLGMTNLTMVSCINVPSKIDGANLQRKPASTQELIERSKLILNEVNNSQIFNAQTCPDFINKITEKLYSYPADYFIPKNETETELLKNKGSEVIDTVFQIRITLHDKLQEFDSRNELTTECMLKMREGFQYARYTEEYLLDWLYTNNIYKFDNKNVPPILTNSKPSTWTNSKYDKFELKTGDVMLVRGKSYVSAMIARIADEEGNFSHLAIVGEDKKGNKYVVEALIQTGTIITPLEEWRKAEDSRVALYRMADSELAQKAGRIVYDKAKYEKDKNGGIRYDFSMNDDDYSKWFCSETVKYAFDKASDGKVIVPKFRSTISKFKDTDYPRSLGITRPTLFAPYDIEVDPRFNFVAEFRHYPLLRQVRMQDSVLQSIYTWMIKKDYSFHWFLGHTVKAYTALLLRQFGYLTDTLPTYMPVESVHTNIQFQAVATALEKNLFAKEDEFKRTHGYLPSFQDMLKINEEYRMQDCKDSQKITGLLDLTKFHTFFYNNAWKCE